MKRFSYAVVSVSVDGKSDAVVADDASKVINDYAERGWRLHTYSYVAADAGGFAKGFAGKEHKNVLHLVFERETDQKPQRDVRQSVAGAVVTGDTPQAPRNSYVRSSDDPLF